MRSSNAFRSTSLFIAVALVLAACGGGGGAPSDAEPPSSSTTATAAATGTVAETAPSTTQASTTTAPTQETEDGPEAVTASATEPEPAFDVSRFTPSDPVLPLTEAQIKELGVDCEGSDGEVAQCILDWQVENMLYCQGTDLDDCTDAIRANYVLPGLFTSHDIVQEETSDGRVYGICHDYSVVYCEIAAYFGLDCRVVNSISKPSERPGTYVAVTTGMSEEEYGRWNTKLLEKGVAYDYEVLRLIAKETPGHYWSEVNLDGTWTVHDGTRAEVGGSTETEYVETGDFEVTDWMANDASEAAYGYAVRIAQGEDLRNEGYDSVGEQFQEGREVAAASGDAENYVGVVDALGQPGRSASMEDFMQGLGLMPYLPSCEATCDFLGAPGECYDECAEENEILSCYEDCSGDPYYLACIYLEDGGDGLINPEVYKACCGVALNQACELQCATED